jgi:site-specific recombinase XerD
MRRTLITNALSAGASVVDMQFVAGHSQASTTLRYAKVKDAQEVKGRVKLPY